MKEQKIGRKTSPGFADPHAPVRLGEGTPAPSPSEAMPAPAPAPVVVPPAAPVPAIPPPSARPRGRGKPLVEIEVLRERSRTPRPEPLAGCYEIWTQNNVYVVDARMRCVVVREVGSGESKADHPFVGARLVGGQTQDVAMEMSHPLPRPGSHAVFEIRKGSRRQFTRTSQVERVVLRLRIVTIADGIEVPTWDDLVADDD